MPAPTPKAQPTPPPVTHGPGPGAPPNTVNTIKDERARLGAPDTVEDGVERVWELVGERAEAGRALGRDAARLALVCRAMAERFRRGGTLLAFGDGLAAADAAHIAVEFTHPVIVGKRALPAVSLHADASVLGAAAARGPHEALAARLRPLVGRRDIALGLSPDGESQAVLRCLAAARDAGALTVALVGAEGGAAVEAADHVLTAASTDPLVAREIHVTAYHVLWELVHVFLEGQDTP
ncbi:SIS domain-containing protein [Actinocorallia sp. API 0066]|uniref:SIS domain-containing protein n=1 Tax=Actinocorallia sp. API 0066 TaxID=2896846 RepID=UPI001E50FDF7|nr:SIS domain-containing protein [Actinocorallia sp. API 0066]MCD0449898.1 SIS domain-containing protein [Actinocorallia sp. API 0066]